MSKIKIFAKSILIPVIIGGIVGILISKSIDYNNLETPPFTTKYSISNCLDHFIHFNGSILWYIKN